MSLKGLMKRKINFFNQHVRLYHSLIYEPQVDIGNEKSKRNKH